MCLQLLFSNTACPTNEVVLIHKNNTRYSLSLDQLILCDDSLMFLSFCKIKLFRYCTFGDMTTNVTTLHRGQWMQLQNTESRKMCPATPINEVWVLATGTCSKPYSLSVSRIHISVIAFYGTYGRVRMRPFYSHEKILPGSQLRRLLSFRAYL